MNCVRRYLLSLPKNKKALIVKTIKAFKFKVLGMGVEPTLALLQTGF
jgi:hypothetical protein